MATLYRRGHPDLPIYHPPRLTPAPATELVASPSPALPPPPGPRPSWIITAGFGAAHRYPSERFIRDGQEPDALRPSGFSNGRSAGARFTVEAIPDERRR